MKPVKRSLTWKIKQMAWAFTAIPVCALIAGVGHAQNFQNGSNLPAVTPHEAASYADLVALADRSEMVIRAQIRRQTTVQPERAPGLAPGFARLYIQARTQALIAGNRGIAQEFAYLVDVPLTAKGKPPKLKKTEVLLFANPVAGRPGNIQLSGKSAQFAYSPMLEQRITPILRALIAADAPPVVTGISDALAVPGTLVGESETQVFLSTLSGAPVSLTVTRRPNQAPSWGVSWGEIIDASARAPQPGSLQWYRLACALPANLPSNANLARDPAARRLATQDYTYVMEQLGPCGKRVT